MSEEPRYHCLSLNEWIKVTSILSYSEVKVLYYFLAQNPLGDRKIDCRIRTIAQAMSMSTGAVSMAIKQLEAKGLIDSVEIVRAEITIQPRLISEQAQKFLDKQRSKKAFDCVQPTEQDVQSTEHGVQPTEQAHIYRARARSETIKTKTDSLQTEEDSTDQPATELQSIAYDWRKCPWMQSATTFKPEMIQAVWQCNTQWYSLEGSKTPNLKKINDRLKSLNNQLKKLGSEATTAYRELQTYWVTAQAITNPEVEQAFQNAAIRQKQQQTRSSIEQALNKPTGGVF